MKRIFLLSVSVVMLFMFTNLSFAKDDDKNRGHAYGQQDRGRNDYRKDHGGDDYHKYPGYRSKSRHDNYHHEHFKNYKYNGHWNSWDSWEKYKRSHPNYARHGHYERNNNQLFFLFNDGINSFMFSIGK